MIGQKLTSMRYKSFTWKYNPATCTYSCQRTYVAHKYPELAGVEIEDMDTSEVIITGKGEFFGPNAYSDWTKLNAEFRTFGPGEFYHPVFTDVKSALMTKLQAEMEPRDDYVSYSFEFVGSRSAPNIYTPSVIPSTPSGGNTSQNIKVGDIVILTGYAYYDSYGNTPRSAYKNGVKYTVTYVNYKGTHPIHCGSLGWCRLQDVKLSNAVATPSGVIVAKAEILHIVKAGETLSGICAIYGANWKQVASYNNIKDPNRIFVGQRIMIPKSAMSQSSVPKNTASGTKNTTSSTSSTLKVGGGNTRLIHMLN